MPPFVLYIPVLSELEAVCLTMSPGRLTKDSAVGAVWQPSVSYGWPASAEWCWPKEVTRPVVTAVVARYLPEFTLDGGCDYSS